MLAAHFPLSPGVLPHAATQRTRLPLCCTCPGLQMDSHPVPLLANPRILRRSPLLEAAPAQKIPAPCLPSTPTRGLTQWLRCLRKHGCFGFCPEPLGGMGFVPSAIVAALEPSGYHSSRLGKQGRLVAGSRMRSLSNTNDKSLESWIWDAACSIRGAQEAPKFKHFILGELSSKSPGSSPRCPVRFARPLCS